MTETAEIKTNEKAYTLRELNSTDIFKMSRIISSIGVNEFKQCFNSPDVQKIISQGENSDNAELSAAVGFSVLMDIASTIISNLDKAEKDIYSFLSDLSGMTKEELEAMSMDSFVDMIIDVTKKDEFTDFLKVVSKLFK